MELQEITLICDEPLEARLQQSIVDFINFCQERLQINNFPTIRLLKERTIKKLTTGLYIQNNNTVYVLIQKRMIIDILRSIAHELTHCAQWEHDPDKMNKLELGTDINSEYENGAAINGSNFLKEFTRSYKNMSEKQLYSLYADWN